jgi:hypothetical protein
MFDTDTLLETTFSDALDTTQTPCPEGEYTAVLDDFKPRAFKTRDGDEGAVLDVFWLPQLDAATEASLGRKPRVKQSIFLDLSASGGLDMGKGRNIGLGRLREAVGQNQPGKPWNFGMLKGSMANVIVSHRIHEGNIYDEVKAVKQAS